MAEWVRPLGPAKIPRKNPEGSTMASAVANGDVLQFKRTVNVRVPCGELDSVEPAPAGAAEHMQKQADKGAVVYSVSEHSWGLYLVWFIVGTLIIWIVLYLLRPAFLQTTNPDGSYTGNVDTSKAFGAAVILALLLVLIVWLVRRA